VSTLANNAILCATLLACITILTRSPSSKVILNAQLVNGHKGRTPAVAFGWLAGDGRHGVGSDCTDCGCDLVHRFQLDRGGCGVLQRIMRKQTSVVHSSLRSSKAEAVAASTWAEMCAVMLAITAVSTAAPNVKKYCAISTCRVLPMRDLHIAAPGHLQACCHRRKQAGGTRGGGEASLERRVCQTTTPSSVSRSLDTERRSRPRYGTCIHATRFSAAIGNCRIAVFATPHERVRDAI